jgi:hypothetical protein
MSTEGTPNQESLMALKERILEVVRSRGFEDSEIKKLIVEWSEKKDQEVVESGGDPRVRIVYESERAEIWEAAGELEEAKATLLQAFYIATHEEGVLDLAFEVKQKAEALGVKDVKTEAQKWADSV